MYLFKYYPLRGLDLVGNVFFSFGHDEDSVSSPAPLSLLSTLFLCHAEADRSLSWSPGKHFHYFPYDLGPCITLASLGCWSGTACREKTTVLLLWWPQTLGHHITMASYSSLICQNKRKPLSPRPLGHWVLLRSQSTRERGRITSLLEAVFSFLHGSQGRDVRGSRSVLVEKELN